MPQEHLNFFAECYLPSEHSKDECRDLKYVFCVKDVNFSINFCFYLNLPANAVVLRT